MAWFRSCRSCVTLDHCPVTSTRSCHFSASFSSCRRTIVSYSRSWSRVSGTYAVATSSLTGRRDTTAWPGSSSADSECSSLIRASVSRQSCSSWVTSMRNRVNRLTAGAAAASCRPSPRTRSARRPPSVVSMNLRQWCFPLSSHIHYSVAVCQPLIKLLLIYLLTYLLTYVNKASTIKAKAKVKARTERIKLIQFFLSTACYFILCMCSCCLFLLLWFVLCILCIFFSFTVLCVDCVFTVCCHLAY